MLCIVMIRPAIATCMPTCVHIINIVYTEKGNNTKSGHGPITSILHTI